ncbi:conserved hypothetical protein [Enterobacterales bacterium 8AC]|nr:conserved hypothetical protein [Enterobacterales bacterium 8AC]
MNEPKKDYLNECFFYQPDNGVLVWNTRPDSHFINTAYAKSWNSRYAGGVAGCVSNGYKVVSVNKRLYFTHRIIWVMHYGDIPVGYEIDHINHVKDDNRVSNLRLVTHSDNQKNLSMLKNNSSGINGVFSDKRNGNWIAQIKPRGKKTKHLGSFGNKSDAIAARKAAEIKYGFHENHGSAKPL